MEDFTQHKIDFKEGFSDGFKRAEAKKPCRWVKHIDPTDGFRCPNPVYSLSYEMGYIYQTTGRELNEKVLDDMFISMVKVIYTEHHNENNK